MPKPTVQELFDDPYSKGELPPYAHPGGYPIVYFDEHDETLCPECATEAMRKPNDWDEELDGLWKPEVVDWHIYYEGPDLYCFECNTTIESAYGDPEEEPA